MIPVEIGDPPVAKANIPAALSGQGTWAFV
jgi:hypothetical protein